MAFVQKLNIMIMASLIGLMALFSVAKSDPNTSVNFYRCNVNEYSQDDPYANSVDYVLADLMNVTPNHGFDYYTQSPYATAVSYGHATCSTGLSYNDCADCLAAARATVIADCANRIGGAVEMVDCSIRYENYSF